MNPFVYLVDLLETQTQATLVLKHILMLPLEMAPRDHIMEHILMLALRNFDASSPDASFLGNMKCFFVEREVGEGRASHTQEIERAPRTCARFLVSGVAFGRKWVFGEKMGF